MRNLQLILLIICFCSVAESSGEAYFSNLKNLSFEQKIASLKSRIIIDSKAPTALTTAKNISQYLELAIDKRKAMDFLESALLNAKDPVFIKDSIAFLKTHCPRKDCLDLILATMSLSNQEIKSELLVEKISSIQFENFYPRHLKDKEITRYFEYILQKDKGKLFTVIMLSVDFGFYDFAKKIISQHPKQMAADKWIFHKKCILHYLQGELQTSVSCFNQKKEGMYFLLHKFYVDFLQKKSRPENINQLDKFAKELSASKNIWFKPVLVELLITGKIELGQVQRLLSTEIYSRYRPGFLFLQLDAKYKFFNSDQRKVFKEKYLQSFKDTFLGKAVATRPDRQVFVSNFGEYSWLSFVLDN